MRSGLPNSFRKQSSRFFRCYNKYTSGAIGGRTYSHVHLLHLRSHPRDAEERLKVTRIPGVLGFVGNERKGTPIPHRQIESLQTAIRGKFPCAVNPSLASDSECAFAEAPSTAWREFSTVRVQSKA